MGLNRLLKPISSYISLKALDGYPFASMGRTEEALSPEIELFKLF